MNEASAPAGVEPPAKVDPETLVLRANPAAATRLRRGVVVAAAATGSAMIIAAAWIALQPPTLGLIASRDDARDAAARAPAEALAGAPRSYGEVPQLGPPLPGDLGRPILRRDQQVEAVLDPEAEAAARAQAAAEAERERLEAEQRAARQSAVMVQLAGGSGRAVGPATTGEPRSPGGVAPAATSRVATGNGAERGPPADANPHELRAAPSPYTLMAGSIIAASLITGLNSDLPGIVTAQITEHVYDSITGHVLLVPQGARLVGSYDNQVSYGQSRALVVWQRLILPDGSSIRIDNASASDTEGYAGLRDRVDRHTWELLKGVALSTLLGVGTELQFGSSESDLVRAIRESAQQNGARAGDQLVRSSLDIPPTLRVRPGWPLRIVVHKDIVLRPWAAGRD